jgi:hypothetical protein
MLVFFMATSYHLPPTTSHQLGESVHAQVDLVPHGVSRSGANGAFRANGVRYR